MLKIVKKDLFNSSILWHFIKGNGTETTSKELDSYSTLDLKILNEKGIGLLKPLPPDYDKYVTRILTLYAHYIDLWENRTNGELFTTKRKGLGKYTFLESRALCFADIPISLLSEHMNRYYGLGLGFRKKVLIDKIEDLGPVQYFPKLTEKRFMEMMKSCKNWEDFSILNGFSKFPSEEESFEQIYSEREWRTFNELEFSNKDLAYILFPSEISQKMALKNDKFRYLFNKGVGCLNFQDL